MRHRHAFSLSMLFTLLASFALVSGCSGEPDDRDVGLSDAGSEDVTESDSGEDTTTMDAVTTDAEDTGGSDTGTDTGDPNDTGGQDTSGADTGDRDAGDDTGDDATMMDCEEGVDSDDDGLLDCEELELCSDQNKADTDDDGLDDLEEISQMTDPCSADTDGDGVEDKKEIELNLDPNDECTGGSGCSDGNLWRVKACDSPSSKSVGDHQNTTGDWTLALPTAFGNYTDLQLSNTSAPVAAAVYDDSMTEVTGAILSKNADSSQDGPVDPLQQQLQSALDASGTVVQDQTGSEFDTHDGHTAATGQYLLEADNPQSVKKLRQKLLLNLAPFAKSDVSSGLPKTNGTKYDNFRMTVTVITRTSQSGADQNLIALAVAPDQQYGNVDKVRFQMDDLTSPTNVSTESDSHTIACAPLLPPTDAPQVDFYWVLDQSGSMDQYNEKVSKFAQPFDTDVKNTSIDYRTAVTNMDKRNDGLPRVPPGWHTDPNTFSTEIDEAVIKRCRPGSSWECSGGDEHGLEAAKRGIEYMTGNGSSQPGSKEAIRNGADIVTIFMSDEEANTIKNDPIYQRALKPYKNFFPNYTTAFAIVGDGDGCGADDGRAYRDIAMETGGASSTLCVKDLTETLRSIVDQSAGEASTYKLPNVPVSSSIEVYVNGNKVPRSRDDGFDYFESDNTIAFFGTHRPTPESENSETPGDFVAVEYDTFETP